MDDKVKYYPYEDYPEEGEKPSENSDNGDYNGGGKKGEKSVKTLIGILVAVLLVLVILLGIAAAVKKNKNKTANGDNVATGSDAVTGISETVTTEAELYPTGDYIVSAEGSLRLREDHSIDAKHIMSVPSGTKLTISEVFIDTNAATPEEKFWGKTEYKGWTAWVAMNYLSKAAGADAEATTLEGESGMAGATTLPGETTTKSGTGGKYEVGKYVVTAETGFVRIREDHDVESEALSEIETDEEITILEVYHDEDADDDTLEYWGKVSYDGYTGWVALYYTKPAA